MVLTRSDGIIAFKHIMEEVLGTSATRPIQPALAHAGIDSVIDLCAIRFQTIENLTTLNTEAETPARIPLIDGHKGLIRTFCAYIHDFPSFDGTNLDDWTSISSADFDLYRINLRGSASFGSSAGTTRPTSSSSSTPTASSPFQSKYTLAELFKRGIKRDSNIFPTLKDEKQNDLWHRSFATQARAQDVSEVLNPSYVPPTTEDRDLFTEKQKFLYAVLESKVLTDRGKAIIRDHENDFDAQAVYKKLVAHHLTSTKAMIDSSTILSYITSSRLGSGEWRGSTESFILHWQNQVRLYERQVPLSDHFSDGQKRTMLENAVHSISELRHVKLLADQEKTLGHVQITYDQYATLLLSAATTYDDQYKPKKERRQVLHHDIFETDNDEASFEDPYDIDAPVSVIQANIHARKPTSAPRPPIPATARMPRDKWMSLSEQQRLLWDQLDDQAKAVILGPPSSRPNGNGRFDRRQRDNPKRQVNLHDISAYDLLCLQANLHDLDPDVATIDDGDPGIPDSNQQADDSDRSDTILINALKATSTSTKLQPGDIRRVMSKSSKRMINVTHIAYRVSAHKTSSLLSLVDRGANGGLAGNDVRVIHKTHRSVNVRGIDNHELTDMAIGTVGGVIPTNKGPVIAIMHQYALLGKGYSIHSPAQLEWFKNVVDDKSVKNWWSPMHHHPGWLHHSPQYQGWPTPYGHSPFFGH